MVKTRKELKRGGIDTIVAYIVVMVPLVYVLVFMVATIYHYTIQMSVNQTVKETLIMASTYGTVTPSMLNNYLHPQIKKVTQSGFKAQFYVRELTDKGVIRDAKPAWAVEDGNAYLIKYTSEDGGTKELQKGDLLGLRIWTDKKSVLGTVSNFSLFSSKVNDNTLHYSSYREEIIRNEYDPTP